jgi:hypothetical protein
MRLSSALNTTVDAAKPESKHLESIVSLNVALIDAQTFSTPDPVAVENIGPKEQEQVADSEHSPTPEEVTQQARKHIDDTVKDISRSLKDLKVLNGKKVNNWTYYGAVPSKDAFYRAFNLEFGNKAFKKNNIPVLDFSHVLGLVTTSYRCTEFSITGEHVRLEC